MMLIRKSFEHYIKVLSSDRSAPGGGSASAAVGSLGVALLLMVARISSKNDTGKAKLLQRTIRDLSRLLQDIQAVIDLDVTVYQKVISAYKHTKKTKHLDGARKRIEQALWDSFRLQADLAMMTAMAKETLPLIRSQAGKSIASDLSVAKNFLDAAFNGALATARINIAYMKSGKKLRAEDALGQLEKKYYGIRI